MVPSRPWGAMAPSSPGGVAQTIPDATRGRGPGGGPPRRRAGLARIAAVLVAASAALALQACADAPVGPGREAASPATGRPDAAGADPLSDGGGARRRSRSASSRRAA
jgi:hypothetical protein